MIFEQSAMIAGVRLCWTVIKSQQVSERPPKGRFSIIKTVVSGSRD
jgi:hypothetical protein